MGVTVDHPFEDGADGLSCGLILGTNISGKVEIRGLHHYMEVCCRQFSDEERTMVLSDAETRLKMANSQLRGHGIEEFFRGLRRMVTLIGLENR